ncbi:protein BIG GRAIN 1-like E [Juglans regia]|nr:protein BIG GRAIN 1-like E [Juglans regia]
MSITALSDPDKFYNKSFHGRNDSGEIDVFEAARYFSGYHEAGGYSATNFTQNKIMRDEIRPQGSRVGRMSLDVPIMRNSLPHRPQHGVEKQMKEKKYKQPSSPGGRLASFLNSLFSQSASKKKKSKSAAQSMKDDQEESPGGRRKRRSSISHFSSSSTADSKSIHSASRNSGFRTPPPPHAHAQTPTKSYRDFGSYSEYHKQMMSLSKYNNGHARSSALHNDQVLDIDKIRINKDLTWLDEKMALSNGFPGKCKNLSKEYSDKDGIWVHKSSPEEKGFRSFGEEDDGAESDSSSDLFELQNYDLGDYSSGLPVYETTNMDSIKRGATISNGVQ